MSKRRRSRTKTKPQADVAGSETSAPVRVPGLRYFSDDRPGLSRRKAGSGFTYHRPNGRRVRDAKSLARIKALVIPPAWTDVWICPVDNGHLQATGRDARGRKQYRYHDKWRSVRDADKYDRMIDFGAALPRMRRRVRSDLRRPGMPREKVLAIVVRLLDTTYLRIGNEDYARENKSFGLTTLRDRHVKVKGPTIHFSFRGKSGVEHEVDVRDRRLAQLVKRCRDLPGQALFRYRDDDGRLQTIESTDVNAYLQEIAGEEFTSKDFRTWAGTMLAAQAIGMLDPPASQRALKAGLVAVVKTVAARLGNTVAVCRKCYIHPEILAAYGETELARRLRYDGPTRGSGAVSRAYEKTVLRVLRGFRRKKKSTTRTPPLARSA